MLVTDASSVANAIEELQDLDAALAAQADGIAESGRIHRAAGLRQLRDDRGQLGNAGRCIEQIRYHLEQFATCGGAAQNGADLVFGQADVGGQGAHPRRIEATGVQLRQHAFQQQTLAFRWRMVMAGQAPPGAHALHAAVVQQVLEKRVPQARCQCRQGTALQAPAVDTGFVRASFMPATQ